MRNSMRSFALKTLSAVLLAAMASAAFAQADIADAASKGNKAEIARLLKRGADVNAQQADGATALQWAAYRGDAKLAELLLKAGAKADLANHDGATPLWLAAARGDAAVIQALLKGGADANEQLPLGRPDLVIEFHVRSCLPPVHRPQHRGTLASPARLCWPI